MGPIELAIMAVMVVFNGVFAGYEIALASVTAARLQVLVGENRAGAKAALYMKQHMVASLAAIQVAVTLLAAIAAAIGGAGAAESLTPYFLGFHLSHTLAIILAIAVVVVPLTMFTILFGELVPKVFSLRNKEWVCLRLSPLMSWFAVAVWPAVWLFEVLRPHPAGLERTPLAPADPPGRQGRGGRAARAPAQAASARASRLISEREESIILGAARLSSRTVREIMLPAENIGMLDLDHSVLENLVVAHLDMHTRFPVAERSGDPQSIIGYVNFKDLVALMRLSQPHAASLRAILRPLISLNAEERLTACLELLIREHTHIAPGARRPRQAPRHDHPGRHPRRARRRHPGRIRPPASARDEGRLGMGRRRRHRPAAAQGAERHRPGGHRPAQPPPEGLRNLSDWIIAQTGGHFRSGDIFERGGVRVVIRKIRRQKVLEAQIGRIDLPATGDAAATEDVK